MSQSDVAREMGVSRALPSKYIRGDRTPTVEQLYRFLRAIGYTDEQLKQERFVDWYSLD